MQRNGRPRAERAAALRRLAARVPTKWLAGVLTGAFLVATAAFGGLATTAEPAPVPRAAGEVHESAVFALSIEKAFLFDELGEAAAYPPEGSQVLALRAQVENLWTAPELTGRLSSLEKALAPDVPGAVFAGTVRIDDGTLAPVLQPGGPVLLAALWYVPEDALADGETVTVVVNDLRLVTGRHFRSGDWWDHPTPAATVSLPVEDRSDVAAEGGR